MVEEKFVKIGQNKIRYLEAGTSRATIVLIHGLGASAERWEKVIPYLSKNYRLIIPDLIGYGQSDKPMVDYSIDFFCSFVNDFLEIIGIGKTNIIGASMGGHIIAECAIAQNNKIQKMILVDPSGVNPILTATLDIYTLAMLYPNRQRVQKAFEVMAGQNRKIDSHVVDDFIKRMNMPNAKMVFMSTLLGLKNAKLLTDRLSKITIPTMVIWGDQDTLIPARFAKVFVSTIEDCKFVKMLGCGHSPYTEEPRKFSRIVQEFLENT